VNVPKGVDSGVNLRISKKGHYSPTGSPGDLMIKINVKPHPTFKREKQDILTDCIISVSQAVLGCTIPVKTLYGDVKIKVQPGT